MQKFLKILIINTSYCKINTKSDFGLISVIATGFYGYWRNSVYKQQIPQNTD